MRADRIYILTFGAPGLPDTDFEVRNCAAALHYKFTSRNRWVEWLHVDERHILRVTAHGASRELVPETLPEAAATSADSQSVRPTVTVYAISHGGAGMFGGFPSPEEGAIVLRAFMEAVGIRTIDQLSLVACATAKAEKGALFLEQLGRAMGEHQREGDSLKIIGWANYVTIFDTRFLVRLLTDANVPLPHIDAFRVELLDSIRGRSADLGHRFADELDRDFARILETPLLGKSFKPAHIGSVQSAISSEAGAKEIARRLFGKKVVRASASVMFFTRPTGLIGRSDALHLPDELTSEVTAVLQMALQNKKSRTFVWQTNVETGRSYLAPATDS